MNSIKRSFDVLCAKGKEEEAQFDAALEMILKTVDFAKERMAIPFAVFKPTGFGRKRRDR